MKASTRASQDSIRRHSKSFSLASRLLPDDARARAVAVYAWCRRADDAIDLAAPEVQKTALQELQSELRDIYLGGSFQDPVLALFQRTVMERDVPERYPQDLLTGFAMDVSGYRYQTLDSLLEYCYYVAGSVGLMMCHVLGVKDETATRNAAHLGIAMQLTNICRDVEEDWRRGRLYIPDSFLAQFGVTGLADRLGEPFPRPARIPVSGAIAALLDEAEQYYRSGDKGLPALSWRCAMAIRTARLVYSSIGGRIRDVDCDPLVGRAFVPLGQKLVLTASSVAVSIADFPRRLIRAGAPKPSAPQLVVRFPDDVLPI